MMTRAFIASEAQRYVIFCNLARPSQVLINVWPWRRIIAHTRQLSSSAHAGWLVRIGQMRDRHFATRSRSSLALLNSLQCQLWYVYQLNLMQLGRKRSVLSCRHSRLKDSG